MIQAILILAIVAFDQITKYFASTVLATMPGQRADFIPGFMSFQYAENTGAAFSIFNNSTWILAIVSTVLSIVVIYFLYKYRHIKARSFHIAMCFIAGGAIGNVIDRIFRGYVVDMLQFDFVNFAIFNVADAFVFFGAIILGIFILWFWDRHKKDLKNELPKE